MEAQRSRGRRSRAFRLIMAVLAGVLLCALPEPGTAQPAPWRTASSLPTPRRLLAAAAEGGKIYTFGGCGSPCFDPVVHPSTFEETRLEVYDPGTDAWSERGVIPAILFGAAAAAPGDGSIYVFGGFVTGNAALGYDPETDEWTTQTPMPTPRHGLAAVALNGDVYVIGGSNGSAPSGALEIYHPATGSWSRRTPMPTARVFLGAAAAGGRIYAIGGSPDCCGNGVTDAVEIYDPATDSWSRGAPLPVALQVSAVAAMNGKVYALGGFIPGAGTQSSTFEYDPARDSWTSKEPMPVGRDQAPAVALGDGVHVLGGSVHCHCRALGDHHSYTPAGLTLRKTSSLDTVCPGQRITYTIVAENAGSPVTGAIVTDDPQHLTNVTWTCRASPGAACAGGGRGPLDDRVDLPAGGTVTYTLSGILDPSVAPVPGELRNTAKIQLPGGVPETASKTNAIVPCASNASIAKDDGLDRVAPGDSPLYRITVRNDSSAALPVRVTDRLAASGLVDVRWCCDAGGTACTPSIPGKLQTSVTLPPNGSILCRATGTVPDRVPSDCRIANTACVTPPGAPAGCASDVDLVVAPNLELALIPGPHESCEVPYTFVVTNPGPSTARDVTLRIEPENFVLLSISGPCQGLRCRFPEIPPRSEVRVTAKLGLRSGLVCPATGRITASVVRPCGSSRTRATSQTLVPCDLAITKTDGRATASFGDQILYTITVENSGCLPVANAQVRDSFPGELVGMQWCGGEGEPEDCEPVHPGDLADLLDLPAGGREVYRASGTIPTPVLVDKLINEASVKPPEGEEKRARDETRIVTGACVTVTCAEIAGLAAEGSMITKTYEVRNCGSEVFGDGPGPEFVDVLPPELILAGATASRGAVTTAASTVSWNGSLSMGETVTLEITAMVAAGTLGSTICNQGTIAFDGDGDGANDQASCCFRVAPEPLIPVLSTSGLCALAFLLALLALVRLRH